MMILWAIKTNPCLYLTPGLIIDAFGELRDQQEQVKEDMEVSLPFLHVPDGCSPPLTAFASEPPVCEQGGTIGPCLSRVLSWTWGALDTSPLKGRETIQNDGLPGTLTG